MTKLIVNKYLYISVKFFFKKYVFSTLNKLLNNLKFNYTLIINLFYKNIELYFNVLKESLLVDYLQKTYLSKLLTQ